MKPHSNEFNDSNHSNDSNDSNKFNASNTHKPSISSEVNLRLFEQRENNYSHISYREEYTFYQAIASGNILKVQEHADFYLKHSENVNSKNGILSKDKLRNHKYHFIILTALITRLCVENGMNREQAYTLSDLYINHVDLAENTASVMQLQGNMILDFTRQMHKLKRSHLYPEHDTERVYSLNVYRCIDYIYNHLQNRLKLPEIADALQLNPSYLSKLFHEETGTSMHRFILEQKLNAARHMLIFSDYSISEIAEYYAFSSQSHFIECFRKQYGMTPKECRNNYQM